MSRYLSSRLVALKRGFTLNKQSHRTVLVVEDDLELQSYMTARVREKGHLVIAAATAKEAIEIAAQRHPTMILTDLQLPTLDELLRLFDLDPLLKNVTIVIIDINHPDLNGRKKLQVLRDFDHLDTVVRGIELRAG